jgi:hypothetical protein
MQLEDEENEEEIKENPSQLLNLEKKSVRF